VEGAPVPLPDDARVGLLHPLAAPPGVVAAWKERLAARGVTPPFVQLERPVLGVPAELREREEYPELIGVPVEVGRMKSTTARLAWRRGDTSGGTVNDYWKAFPLAGLVARLFVDDMPIVLELGGSARLGRLVFERREPAHQRLKLGEVPALIVSETLADLQKISGRAPTAVEAPPP